MRILVLPRLFISIATGLAIFIGGGVVALAKSRAAF